MVREHSIRKPKPLSFESVWFYKLKTNDFFEQKITIQNQSFISLLIGRKF